jgi:hypothetical protein
MNIHSFIKAENPCQANSTIADKKVQIWSNKGVFSRVDSEWKISAIVICADEWIFMNRAHRQKSDCQSAADMPKIHIIQT